METLPLKIVNFFRFLFKSYYVVWKRIFCDKSCKGCTWFKSYYVVWKLAMFWNEIKGEAKFKSYYVVWKLINDINSKDTVKRV